MLFIFRGYYVIFLEKWGLFLHFSVKRKVYAGDSPRVQ